MMRAVVVDDELLAREELEALLVETGEVTIVGSCANAIQAIRTIKSTRPDVLFLDIQMPKLDGLKMLSMIDAELMPCVVFVTAYDEYAIDAFEKDAVDYLVKPVQPERLARAIARLKRFLGEGRTPRYDSPLIERIPCMGSQSIKLIDTSEVEFVRSSEMGVHVVTAKGEFLTDNSRGRTSARNEGLPKGSSTPTWNSKAADAPGRNAWSSPFASARARPPFRPITPATRPPAADGGRGKKAANARASTAFKVTAASTTGSDQRRKVPLISRAAPSETREKFSNSARPSPPRVTRSPAVTGLRSTTTAT